MEDFPNVPNLLTLVDAVIDGKVSAADAGQGLPPVISILFDVSERLGLLNRGNPVHFGHREAGLLHNVLESAVTLAAAGKTAKSPSEKICSRLMDLAFAQDDPGSWAYRLSAIRHAGDDGQLDAMTPERMSELSRRIKADKHLMVAHQVNDAFQKARRLLDEVAYAVSSEVYPDAITVDDITLTRVDAMALFAVVLGRFDYVETYLGLHAKRQHDRVCNAKS